MYLLTALLACGGDDFTQPTDAPKNVPNNTPDAGNASAGGPGGDVQNNGQPQGNMGGQMGGEQGQGGPGGEGQMGGPGGPAGGPGGPGGEGQMGVPGGEGQNIGAAVPPEDGENIGDPNIPPDTINETIGKDGQTPPQPMDVEVQTVVSKNQRKNHRPSSSMHKATTVVPFTKMMAHALSVRIGINPTMVQWATLCSRDCPPQMSSDAWENCPNGRLVKHNVGDKEGTCECQPIERGQAK